jgi:hypothetical protein
MSPDENRRPDNLIVLCLVHADEIMQPENAERYPVHLLRDWKRLQRSAYQAAAADGQDGETLGWQLTDEEAAEVVRESERWSPTLNVRAAASQAAEASGGQAAPAAPVAPVGYGYVRPAAGPVDLLTTDRLAVSALMLVNYAEVAANGLASVVGAGWQSATVRSVPSHASFSVFAVIEAGRAPAGQYAVTFEMRNPSGELRSTACVAVVVGLPADVVRVPAVLGLRTGIDELGTWTLTVRSGPTELGRLSVAVIPMPEIRRRSPTAPSVPAFGQRAQ